MSVVSQMFTHDMVVSMQSSPLVDPPSEPPLFNGESRLRVVAQVVQSHSHTHR